jgi:UDP-GlcNAc:undecaprenyl-phosphate GlcNAc-1-phosphate transferase
VGYALAVTAITGFQKAATSLAVTVPLLIFALPLAETASSTTRRLLQQPGGAGGGSLGDVGRRLRRVVQADSAHFHHRLMQLGLSPRATVLVLYSVAVFLSLLALASARIP